MKIILKDANVIFSLLDSGLLDYCLRLNYEVWTSDFVINEIMYTKQGNNIQRYVHNKGINVYNFSGEEVAEIFRLSENKSLSDTDCSVLLLTIIKKGILISSDKLLNSFTVNKGIEVKGLTWILDELVMNGILDPCLAAEKLEFIATCNTSTQITGTP